MLKYVGQTYYEIPVLCNVQIYKQIICWQIYVTFQCMGLLSYDLTDSSNIKAHETDYEVPSLYNVWAYKADYILTGLCNIK